MSKKCHLCFFLEQPQNSLRRQPKTKSTNMIAKKKNPKHILKGSGKENKDKCKKRSTKTRLEEKRRKTATKTIKNELKNKDPTVLTSKKKDRNHSASGETLGCLGFLKGRQKMTTVDWRGNNAEKAILKKSVHVAFMSIPLAAQL